jgi:hypothetical protein
MVIDVAYFMGELQPWEWVEEYFAPRRDALSLGEEDTRFGE